MPPTSGAPDRHETRLRRELQALARRAPVGGGVVAGLAEARNRRLRAPVAILLILGGFLGFLPVLGFWMIPLGLLLLAVDLPWLRPKVGAAMVRLRRRARRLRRRRARR